MQPSVCYIKWKDYGNIVIFTGKSTFQSNFRSAEGALTTHPFVSYTVFASTFSITSGLASDDRASISQDDLLYQAVNNNNKCARLHWQH